MEENERIENLEQRIEDMLSSQRNERATFFTVVTALISPLVETNKQLIALHNQQMQEIAILRSENHHLRELVKLESTLT